ncbi:MAG: hypothetical protein Q9160_000789 [Pyrenula sp. 1 TL-2023]
MSVLIDFVEMLKMKSQEMPKMRNSRRQPSSPTAPLRLSEPKPEPELGVVTSRIADESSQDLKDITPVEYRASEQAKPIAKHLSSISAVASTTHQISDPPPQAETDSSFVLPYNFCDQASKTLGGNEVLSSKLHKNDSTGPIKPRNASEDTYLQTTYKEVHKSIQSLKEEQGQTYPTPQILRNDNNNNDLKNRYRYSPLSEPGSIRLLRLMPHKEEGDHIQCELFGYPLQESDNQTQLYEALSYVWGSSEKIQSIVIGKHHLSITANLYAALSYLRDRLLERVIWVDAVCINQDDTEERGQQVQRMAEIYGKANRVIVWLGKAESESDQALEQIRVAADDMSAKSLAPQSIKQAILTLLQRPWFRRIWVLQEVAAARHVQIKCGSTEIDGYAFSLGLQSLQLSSGYIPKLWNLIRSVVYLIRGSIFRPKYTTCQSGRVSLDIRPLGELIDMYHTHKATERLDKVFALLVMSSDNLNTAGLLPDYRISWEELFQQLVKFLLGEEVIVETWTDSEMAVIKSKGYVLGHISDYNTSYNNRQQVVKGYESKLGKGHLRTLVVKDKLALMNQKLKQWEEAKNTLEQVIQTRIRIQGAKHPDTMSSMTNLVSIYQGLGYQKKMEILKAIIAMLGQRDTTQIAEENMKQIASSLDEETLTFFLNQGFSEVLITEGVVTAAAANSWSGYEVIKLLLDRRGSEVPITEGVVTAAAAANSGTGYEVIKLLLDRRGSEVQITEGVVTAAAANSGTGYEVIKLLLDRRGSEVPITEGVVTAAAAAAAAKSWAGYKVIELLRDRRGSEIPITEGVVTAAR